MRRVALAVLLLTLSCSAGTTARPSASPAPLRTPGVTFTVSPSPSPLSIPSGELLYGVLEPENQSPDTVAIVGLDGYARAKAPFTRVQLPYVGCAAAVAPPQAYAVGNRIYFLDGNGVVRYLDTKGNLIQVARFPHTDAQQEVSFAVSPDGRRLLGTVLTLPPKPDANSCANGVDFAPGNFTLDVYSADAGQAPTRVNHQSFAQTNAVAAIVSFIGWDATGPIATNPTAVGTQGGGPTHWFGHPVRTDMSGKVLGDLGGGGCNATDDLPDGTVACALESSTSVRRADGTEIWHASQQLLGGRLAPDAQRVVGFGDKGQVAIGADGSVANLFGEFFVNGWLDNATVIGNFVGGEIGIQKIAPPAQGKGQGYQGTFVGVVQRP
jgi:hypothetical protein